MALAVALGAALAPAAARAGADDPASPIEGDSTCPRPEAVTQALGAVGADWRELAARLRGGGPLASIADLGGGFRVTMLGRSRDYFDPRRDCDERARMAAVVVALMVDALAPPPEARVERPAPPARPPPVAAPARRRALSVELAAQGAAGFAPAGDTSAAVHAGASLAVGPVALVLGAGAAAPHTLDLGLLRARVLRFPATLGARLFGRVAGLDLGIEVGAAAALTRIQNENPATPVRGTRAELGAHAGVLARFAPDRRLSPLLGLSADFFPVSYAYVADPIGDVGHAARVWLGVSVGAIFDLL